MSVAEVQQLIPHFHFTFPGKIWKLKPDFQTRNLVIEVRQPEMLQAGFYCFSTQTGNLLLENYQPAEQWWLGLEGAQNGLFLLHKYQDKETGRHLEITAVSEKEGRQRWEKPQLTFRGFLASNLLLAEDLSGNLVSIEITSGKEKKYTGTPEHAKSEMQSFALNGSKEFQVPLPYLPSDAYYPLLQDFIRKQTGREAQQTIEYLETEKHILLSFYAEKDSVLANFLLVCSAQGRVLLDICLETDVAGLGSDTFFIFAAKLFFIQEKMSLACFLL